VSSVWPVVKLGDISDVITKGTTPTSVGHQFSNEGISFIKVESLSANGEFIRGKFAYITDLCHEDLRRSQLKEGDVLFSIAGALGRTAIVNKSILPANTNQALAIIRLKPSSDYTVQFIYKALSTGFTLEQIERHRGGVAQQNLSLAQIKSFEIPLPPLEEQKRIVAILDEAFIGIDAAIANTQKNLANARELFESYLNAVFTQRGERWEEMALSDTCEITSKLIDPREEDFFDLPHIGAGNIVSMTGELIKVQTAREEGLKSGKFTCDEQMVLYSKIRPYLMKVARPSFSGLCSADIYPLTPKSDVLSRDFLYYLLLSKEFTDYAIAGSARAGMPKVNRDHLFQYRVALPDIVEQKILSEKLDSIESESQALASIYQQKLNALNELKQSLLQKAFSGELTTADETAQAQAVA
jgi:type I restriction enzyme S subunit